MVTLDETYYVCSIKVSKHESPARTHGRRTKQVLFSKGLNRFAQLTPIVLHGYAVCLIRVPTHTMEVIVFMVHNRIRYSMQIMTVYFHFLPQDRWIWRKTRFVCHI